MAINTIAVLSIDYKKNIRGLLHHPYRYLDRHINMRPSPLWPVLLCIATRLVPAAGLTPLTKIKATEVELSAFAATALGAVEAIIPNIDRPIIHVLGTCSLRFEPGNVVVLCLSSLYFL